MKKERLRESVKQAMEGQATAGVVADGVRAELLTAHKLSFAANRLAKLGSAVKTRILHRTHKSQCVPYSHTAELTQPSI
jgi:hypothetical protein